MVSRIIIWPQQHPIVSAEKFPFCHQISGSPAGTSGKNNKRRLWPMHRLYSAELKGPICLHWVNHVFWWGPSWNYERWWNCTFHFLMFCLGQCGPTGGVLQESDLSFHGCPAHPLWCFTWRSSCNHWQTPQGIYTTLGAIWEMGENGGSSKPIPGLGEGVTPLLAGHHSGTSPISLWGHEVKALPPEFWSKESSTPEGGRAVAGRVSQKRFTFTWASGTNTHGCPAPGLWEGNILPVRRPITCGHPWGSLGIHTARCGHQTCCGYNVC